VQFLGVDFWNGSVFSVRGYIRDAKATYPVLRDGGYLRSASEFGIAYDNYVVIDPDGIVRYTSVNEAFLGIGRWNDDAVRAVVEQWIPTAVQETTWTALKSLYLN
jgi:alkyl hydroperoxide reductase subunit AhpC